MGKIAEQIRELRRLCTHPKISGTERNKDPWGYGHVDWTCIECGSDITEDSILKKATVISFLTVPRSLIVAE
jgi:hypothetical protein